MIRERLASPHAFEHPHIFFEAANAEPGRIEADACRTIFVDRPAGPEARLGTTTAQDIESCPLAGSDRRMAEIEIHDECSQPHGGGDCSRECKREHRRNQVMLVTTEWAEVVVDRQRRVAPVFDASSPVAPRRRLPWPAHDAEPKWPHHLTLTFGRESTPERLVSRNRFCG